MDNEKELEGTQQNPEEGQEPSQEQTEDVSKLKETNKGLYERLKKEEAKRKELEQKLVQNSPKVEENKEKDKLPQVPGLTTRDVLRLRADGWNDKEILAVEEEATSMGVSPSKLLESSLYKAGLEARRAKERSEQATPSPSSRSSLTVGDKPFNKAMETAKSVDEVKSVFNEAAEKALQRARR